MNIENYINGEMRASHSGAVLDNYNPASGKVYGTIPNSDAKDVAEAYAAAAAAFPVWSNTPSEERFKVLNAIAEGIDNLRDALAMAESNDQGKPLWLAKNEMIRAAQNFRFFATAAMQFSSESHAMENRAINYTLRTPIAWWGVLVRGICHCICLPGKSRRHSLLEIVWWQSPVNSPPLPRRCWVKYAPQRDCPMGS